MIARGITIGLLLAVPLVAWPFLDTADRVAVVVGFGICVPPAVLTYRLVVRVWAVRPDFGPVAVMVGTGLRMAWTVAMVLLVADAAPEWGTTRAAVANAAAVAYVVTLAAETAALARRLSRRPADARPAGG